MKQEKIIVSPGSIAMFLGLILLVIFLFQIKNVLLLLFASFVITCALLPSVDWMSKKVPRGIVVAFVYLLGLVAIITLLIPFITVITKQLQDFVKVFPTYWEHLVQFVEDLEIMAASTGFIPDYTQMFTNAAQLSQDIVTRSIGFTINLFAGIAGAFTLAVLVLFMLLDKKVLKDGVLKLFPPKYREKTTHIIETIAKKVGGYVRGQLSLMLLVGLLTAVGLQIIGVEFALLLGITAGILEIIPIVGPVVATIPGVFVAFAQEPILGLWALLVYIIVQRIENHILTPMILGKFLEMHPLIIIAAILIAASTLGVFGVILSPAIAASIYVLVQELYLEKIEQQA